VEEADRWLSELVAKGHLEDRFEHGRLLYFRWEGGAPLWVSSVLRYATV
jgi:hypothetical protein